MFLPVATRHQLEPRPIMPDERTRQRARLAQSETAAVYDRIAPVYDVWGLLTESKARDLALRWADIRPGEHVLEVAVGTGLAFERLVRSNPDGRTVGIDLSPGMLEKARSRLQRAGLDRFDLSVGTAEAIDEPDEAFDLLLNAYLFDLLDEPAWSGILGEFMRVLKPGGRLVMVNMTLGERSGSGLYERVYRLWPALMGGCRGVRLSGALEESGFSVERRTYLQQMLFPSEVILARKGGG